MTAIFAVLPFVLNFHIENMRTVNGQVVEYFRLDVFQVVAAGFLLGAFIALLLRFRSSEDPARRPPMWAVAVGVLGVVLGIWFALTAHTGLDDVTAVLAGR
ncbi:hypothetical protein ACPYO6_13475 [Georgenia sp. Z1344]|uniref:hypothetical protein n=1 Tax=Georgenia sp. Z1344 TaxID=3416706 RepID=UPI003CE7946A